MPLCYFCGKEIESKGRVMRKDICPHCQRDLHACVQCRFHDPGYHNQCREPKAEMIRDRERANLCEFFEFGGGQAKASHSELEVSRRKLEGLFKKS